MASKPIILFKKLRPDAVIPQRASDGAAGFDLSWCPDMTQHGTRKEVAMDSEGTSYEPAHTFDTGIAVSIPKGYVGLVFSRSGHGFFKNVRLSNCVGVIDSDYRGEIKVRLIIDKGYHSFRAGERVAQLVVIPFFCDAIETQSLDETNRDKGGFGSTGA